MLHYSQSRLQDEVQLRSGWFSNDWTLTANGFEVARLRRFPRLHVSSVTLAGGGGWTLEPFGFATVRALDLDNKEVARITRKSWWGRRWEVTGVGFAYGLISHRIPRRWNILLGEAPLAEIKGNLLSYNTVTINAPLTIPTVVAVLAWQVIARPWEAAAAPRGLVPKSRGGEVAAEVAVSGVDVAAEIAKHI